MTLRFYCRQCCASLPIIIELRRVQRMLLFPPDRLFKKDIPDTFSEGLQSCAEGVRAQHRHDTEPPV